MNEIREMKKLSRHSRASGNDGICATNHVKINNSGMAMTNDLAHVLSRLVGWPVVLSVRWP